jgi:hypothetical protein
MKNFKIEDYQLEPEHIKTLKLEGAGHHREGAARPARSKTVSGSKRTEPFAMVPRWWAARACSGGGYGPNLLVCWELIHRSWKAGGEPFKMPNVKGVSPQTKIRMLHLLEEAGLITVKWRNRKSPVVAMTIPTR